MLVVVYGVDDRREETFFDLHPLVLIRLKLIADEKRNICRIFWGDVFWTDPALFSPKISVWICLFYTFLYPSLYLYDMYVKYIQK